VLALLPLAIFAAALMYLLAEKGSAAARESLERADQSVKEVVRSELERATSELRQLATASESLDISLTKRLASSIVGPEEIFNAVLLASSQSDTVLAGLPVPRVPIASLPPSGVTDLQSVGQPSQGAVEVVFSKSDGAVILVGQLNLQRLARLLAKYAGPNNYSTVLDENKFIIARSQDFDRFFGQHPSQQTLNALAQSPNGGAGRFKTRDGRELFWAWTTLDKPRWTVFLGTPAEGLDQAFHRSLLQLISGASAALGLGLLAAWLLGRRILSATDDLAEQAPGLVFGETPRFRRSGLRQIDSLYQAMSDAGRELTKAHRERDEALAAERAARELAERHNQAKDVFLATLSHELRNPLAPIVTASKVLQLPSATADQRDKAAQVIGRQASTLSQLLDDLLDVSRITTGRVLLNMQDVRVSEVIDEAVETVSPLLEERRHRLVVNTATGLVTRGDRLRLIQVVANLLNNAAKYTDVGGRISVEASPESQEQLLIAITDNGIGISADALERVFEIFEQLEEQRERSRGGLGIGLSLVKGIVELHGGSVAVFSEGPGAGSRFEVRLPRTDTTEGPSAIAPAELCGQGERQCVMVVDDNADAAETMKLLLEASGQFDVDVEHSAEAALQTAAKRRHDAICLDIGLPDMTGYELARRLKRVSSAKLIATTGWGSADDKQRAFEAGFDAHLTKPIDPEQLMGQLHLLSGR
jgi:signal transduction histidine kinase